MWHHNLCSDQLVGRYQHLHARRQHHTSMHQPQRSCMDRSTSAVVPSSHLSSSLHPLRLIGMQVDGIAGAAQHMGVPEEVLLAEVRQYNTAAQAQSGQDKGQAAPEGTAPPGKFGKRYFPSLLDEGGSVWVARVTPVVHYCMGGMAIGPDARVLGADESPLPCVWAAGEAAGGLHGRNRLGGNSLAECVVFGRIAGAAAAKDLGECCGVSTASDAAEVVHARAAI